MHRADGLVVGIEQEIPARVKTPIAGFEMREQELLEEPGGMREMPFRGACVRHRLRDGILRRQCGAQRQRRTAYALVACGRILALVDLEAPPGLCGHPGSLDTARSLATLHLQR